jgi:hypothetical protein
VFLFVICVVKGREQRRVERKILSGLFSIPLPLSLFVPDISYALSLSFSSFCRGEERIGEDRVENRKGEVRKEGNSLSRFPSFSGEDR